MTFSLRIWKFGPFAFDFSGKCWSMLLVLLCKFATQSKNFVSTIGIDCTMENKMQATTWTSTIFYQKWVSKVSRILFEAAHLENQTFRVSLNLLLFYGWFVFSSGFCFLCEDPFDFLVTGVLPSQHLVGLSESGMMTFFSFFGFVHMAWEKAENLMRQ